MGTPHAAASSVSARFAGISTRIEIDHTLEASVVDPDSDVAGTTEEKGRL